MWNACIQGNIAESGLLSSTALPPLTYPADGLQGFGGGIVETGKLSKLQLEVNTTSYVWPVKNVSFYALNWLGPNEKLMA